MSRTITKHHTQPHANPSKTEQLYSDQNPLAGEEKYFCNEQGF